MATVASPAREEPPHGTLRRELRFWEAIALSIGIMAPTAAMALNGVAPAGLVGRAVPLAFLFAAIAIGLVSYSFIRLTRHFNHAGSAYALNGATLGPHVGFLSGWALMGTYTAFTAASTAEVGLFGYAFFDGTGIWHKPPWIVIALTGVFYVVCMLAQSLGFGINAPGVKAFSSSGAPLGDLSNSFISHGYADAVNFGAMVSAFASALGTATGASRILFANGRDGFISRRLGDASARTGAPANALAVVMAVAVAVVVGLRINHTSSTNVFFYMGTIGVLSLLVAYIATNVGAFKFLVIDRRENPLQTVILAAAVAALVYVIYKNVRGVPYPYKWFPYVVLGWLVLGGAIIAAAPGLARRIGANLTRAEGMGRAGPTA